jgi:hypothetical protein
LHLRKKEKHCPFRKAVAAGLCVCLHALLRQSVRSCVEGRFHPTATEAGAVAVADAAALAIAEPEPNCGSNARAEPAPSHAAGCRDG